MNFDALVGNPPYLKGLWKQFLVDSARLSKRYVAMVAPNGTDNLSEHSEELKEFLRQNGIQAKIDCTDQFPTVSSGKIVTYYLDKAKAHNPEALSDRSIPGEILQHLIKITDTMPARQVVQGTYDILEKSTGEKRNRLTDSRSNREVPDERHTLPVLTSSTREGNVIRYFETDYTARRFRGDAFTLQRFFATGNTVANHISIPDGICVGGNVLWFTAHRGETLESFLSVYASKLYRLAFQVIKNGQTATTPKHFTFLPCPPLTKVYTEAELHELLGITNPTWINYLDQYEI